MCEEFCLVTKDKIGKLLNDLRVSGRLGVGPLTDTMKATIAFEKELNKRFKSAAPSGTASMGSASVAAAAAPPEGMPPSSAAMSPEALRQKWRRFQEERQSGAPGTAALDANLVPSNRFTRIIRQVHDG